MSRLRNGFGLTFAEYFWRTFWLGSSAGWRRIDRVEPWLRDWEAVVADGMGSVELHCVVQRPRGAGRVGSGRQSGARVMISCSVCRTHPRVNATRCETCRRDHNEAEQMRRQARGRPDLDRRRERIAAGLCGTCGTARERATRASCETCRVIHNESAARTRARLVAAGKTNRCPVQNIQLE